MKTIKLLLIEDDVNLSYIMKSSLENVIGGYEVDTALNGKEGLEHYQSLTPDVIVSDIEMPVMNGFEMVKAIRQTDMDIPIILATGKVISKDVTAGFEAGTDYYIKKPYSPDELDVQIRALIHLKDTGRVRSKNTIRTVGKYTFDPKNFTLIYKDSEKTNLSFRESQILELLLQNKGEIVKREDILKTFWNEKMDHFYASRSLDVFITKLRKYLSKDSSVSIKNVKQVGLILEVG